MQERQEKEYACRNLSESRGGLTRVGLIVVLVALGAILGPLVGEWGPDYAREEANIVAIAILALVAGALLVGYSRKAQGTRVT